MGDEVMSQLQLTHTPSELRHVLGSKRDDEHTGRPITLIETRG